MATLLGSLWLGACSVFGIRGGTPEPGYAVLAQADGIEIRRYGAGLAAESTEAGTEQEARETGFRRLAGYIFGGNRGAHGIEMTAPVAQQAAPSAPTEATPAPDKRWTIRFFLPAQLSNPPAPRDPGIRIVPVPAAIMAVRRFPGTPTPAAVADQTRSLLAALPATGWRADGPPVAWFYDPPWTLPPLRRNEVAVPVQPAARPAP